MSFSVPIKENAILLYWSHALFLTWQQQEVNSVAEKKKICFSGKLYGVHTGNEEIEIHNVMVHCS